MKHARQLLFSILLFLSVIASAQNTYLYITVDPIDAITESTLTEARVSLLNPTDSTEVDTFRRLKIIGDMIPRYTFVYENKQTTLPFKYIVRIENEGYETSYANLSILPSEEKQGEVIRDMGRVRLPRIMKRKLDELVVSATKIMMVMKGDTLVYDATMFQLAEGSMLDELIKQLPGVRLEEGGRITVNGHFISTVCWSTERISSAEILKWPCKTCPPIW